MSVRFKLCVQLRKGPTSSHNMKRGLFFSWLLSHVRYYPSAQDCVRQVRTGMFACARVLEIMVRMLALE